MFDWLSFYLIMHREIVEYGSCAENDVSGRLTEVPSEFRALMVAPWLTNHWAVSMFSTV
jgi:hypothetical protein